MLGTVQSALHIISHLIRSILQTRKLSLKEVRILAQGHLDVAEGNVVTKPATLSVAFWPPELWGKKVVVWSHQFEVICYNSLRRLWVHSPSPATQFWALLSTQHLVHEHQYKYFCRLPKSESKFKWQWIVSVHLLSNLAFLSRWLQALLSSDTFSRSLIFVLEFRDGFCFWNSNGRGGCKTRNVIIILLSGCTYEEQSGLTINSFLNDVEMGRMGHA